jgi:cell division protein FtsB
MQQQGRNVIQHLVNFTVGSLMAFILVAGCKGWLVKWNQWDSLKNKRTELANSLKTKKDDIAKIKENIERFNTDRDFVEDLARKSRKVFRSDIVFVFDEGFKN